MSSSPSSTQSYSERDVEELLHKGQEHFKYVLKTFKVAELDKLLAEKKKPTTGEKADKAIAVAWEYTRQEIEQWKEKQRTRTTPAILRSSSFLRVLWECRSVGVHK